MFPKCCSVKTMSFYGEHKKVFGSFIKKLITINIFNMPCKVLSNSNTSWCVFNIVSLFTHISEELSSLLVIFNSSHSLEYLYLSFIWSLLIFIYSLFLLSPSSYTRIKLSLFLKRRVYVFLGIQPVPQMQHNQNTITFSREAGYLSYCFIDT